MILELSINGARVIVSGENVTLHVTEESALDAVKVTTPKASVSKASKPETSDLVTTPEHLSPAVPTAKATAGAASQAPAPATNRKAEFVMRPAKPLRPYCQKPGSELCGGSGRNHCQACTKLMAESGEAA